MTFRGHGFSLKLRGKLTLTFLAVGLVLTSVNVWSTRSLQRRWEDVLAKRTETVRVADALSSVGNDAFEEGFGYVLSGDRSERDACLSKLANFEALRRELLTHSDIPDRESRVLAALGVSWQRSRAAAQHMFEAYEAQGHLDRSSYDAYDKAMDALADGVRTLNDDILLRAASDSEASRGRLNRELFAIAMGAAVIAISIGTGFGIRLTRPLFWLRNAAIRVCEGHFDFAPGDLSQDELGELTRAFAAMAANIRRLLAAEAEQKSNLANIFASLGETLLVCGPDGRITAVNRAACVTLGYAEHELVGSPLDAVLVAVHFGDLLARAMRHSLDELRTNADADPELLRKDGKPIAVSLSVSLLRTADSEAVGLICVAQDLSVHRRLEAELRQAQKLEAIGRLASGIAHEINTPVQFVSDSIYFVRDGTKDLLSLVEKYRAVHSDSRSAAPASDALAALRAAEEEIDLPYIVARLPRAVDRALEGLSRIATIVRSMKIFAHPDQRLMAPVDLNQAVQSTLMVACNEYKYVAELETEFGDLPPVKCHAGEVNQAVLNLIVNAAHAIADHAKEGEKGLIRVRTRREGDSAVISISDTGGGIPSSIRDRIFDPFFTTKEVGRGTGQGLSVARSVIVEKHHGRLSFETELGRGTTFEVRLPLVS